MIQTEFTPAALALASFVALAGCASTQAPPVTQSMNSAPAPVAAAVADTPDVTPGLIKRVQAELRHEGLYKGRIDGVWGPQSVSAIDGYQQAHSLTDSGELDAPTLASLKTVSADTKTMPAATATRE